MAAEGGPAAELVLQAASSPPQRAAIVTRMPTEYAWTVSSDTAPSDGTRYQQQPERPGQTMRRIKE